MLERASMPVKSSSSRSVSVEPCDCFNDALTQVELGTKPEALLDPAGIETTARLSVGLGPVPYNLDAKTDFLCDYSSQFADRNFAADPEVHWLIAVIALGR